MSRGTVPERLRVVRDHRGMVFEPLGPDALCGQKNVHVVLTRPGEVRGNHFHRHATEILSAVGPVLVRVKEAGEVRDYDVPEGETWRFTFPPGVAHAIRTGGSQPGVLVSFSDRPHNPQDPDTHRELLLE